ncbi:META domain-containing protein [Sphingomicrobium nitratireducens]|uniref:META domain-containing protein n=1 Tax=Sphingomicrobium nitratireducens TaxID=2964666 RepID=UPI0022409F1A|nr:META domain-containing protein [Sphingomicrobium nitratireducens]
MKTIVALPLLALALGACTTGPYGNDPYGGGPYGTPYPQQPQGYPYPAPYPTPYPGTAQPGLQEPYRAIGTEPGWILNIDNRDMRFEGDYGQFVITEATPPVQPGYAGDIFRGRRLEVNIVHAPCNDGMSDRSYPDRVQVYADGRRYEGCGGPLSLFGQGWSSGQSPYGDQGYGYGSAAMLARSNWQVVALNGRQTPTRDFYINFFPDNRMQAKFGCNTISAGYQQTGSTLNVGAQMTTRMGCPDMGPETTGSNILSQPMQVSLTGETLRLSNSRGSIEARRVD